MYRQSSAESWAEAHSKAKEIEPECLDSGFLSEVLDSAQMESTLLSVEPSRRTPSCLKSSLEPSCVDSGVIDVIPEDDDCLCSPVLDEKQYRSSLAAVEESADDCASQDDLMELLTDAFAPDEDGETALHSAILQGATEAVFSIVRLAPSSKYLNVRNGANQTPLHVAALFAQALSARRLVIAGASMAARDACGNTALHLACSSGDLATLKCFTTPVTSREVAVCPIPRRSSTGPSVLNLLETRNDDGLTCFQVAAIGGHHRIVTYLASLGADIDAVEGKSGKTAAHLCAELGLAYECSLLARLGADLTLTTWKGFTAADSALSMGHDELAEQLCSYGSFLSPEDDDDEDDSDDCESYDDSDSEEEASPSM